MTRLVIYVFATCSCDSKNTNEVVYFEAKIHETFTMKNSREAKYILGLINTTMSGVMAS